MLKRLLLLLLPLVLLQCDANTYPDGAAAYKAYCAGCHVEGGTGLGTLIPPVAGSDYMAANLKKLPCIIRYGLKDTIVVNGVVYSEEMVGIPQLNDVDITNLLNYIQHEWGAQDHHYTLGDVRQLLSECGE
ncbi:MAG: cytochrome c [Lewinellaceae bacterium]|nr:cytochrome c [Lewinellaceae bacterium]